MRSEVPRGWRDALIGDAFTLQRGFDITRKEQRAGNVPVVSSGGVSSFHDTAMAKGPGVVIGRKGTLGTAFYMPADYWPHDTTLWVRDFKGSEPKFVYYFLKNFDVMHLDVGSANPTLNRNHVHALPVLWPPRDEQERIAGVLGALDDKIDGNRRLAALLEQTVAALFKASFVDFVGVEEFEDSEIGPVPAGWRVGSLVDIARFVNGKAFTKDATGEGWPILRIRELNGGVDAQTLRGDLNAADDNVARAGDILFAWSGSLGAYRWPGQESLINQHIFKVVPEGLPSWYVYGWINEYMDQFRRTASDRAVTMGHIKREHLSAAKLPIPDIADLQDADSAISPLDQHRAALVAEQQTLTKLRDALLPKLISGAIRVLDTADLDEVIGPMVEAAS